MSRLIATALEWILGKLGLLIVILAILLVGSWLKAEWDQHRAAQAALEQQESVLENLRGELQSIEVAIAADQAEWRRSSAERLRALWDELDALTGRIRGFEKQSQIARGQYLDLAQAAQEARSAARQAK